MNMKKYGLLTLVLFLITSVGYGQMTDIKESLKAKEMEMYEAIKSGDMEPFETNLADNFMGVYSDGMIDRDKEMENIKKLKMDSYELSDIKVMQPAENVGIIAYTLDASGMYEDKKFSGKYYSTSTWVKENGEWKAVIHTEAKATPMEETMGMENENEDEDEY